jgi:hypothetical protein
MGSQKPDVQTVRTILKNKAQRQVGPAFEQVCAQFANAQPAVEVGLAENIAQIAQGLKTLRAVNLLQRAEAFDHLRINRERFFQATRAIL